MNQQAAKRPRSDSKILPPTKKKQKKSKSSKSNKQQHHHTSDKDTPAANSLELTATAEGITMTQVLSTFHRMEQSRFEAFRRSTFRGDAISKYVAHCLEESEKCWYAENVKSRKYLGVPGNEKEQSCQQHCPYVKNAKSTTANKRSLQDMVPPGQAAEIAIVVSTLAKSYAQRLVTAARRVAAAQGADPSTPLEPQQVLTAHYSRVQAGLDPGFFLQKQRNSITVVERSAAAALGIDDANALQRNATLAAQEEYDKYMKEKNETKSDDMDVHENSRGRGG